MRLALVTPFLFLLALPAHARKPDRWVFIDGDDNHMSGSTDDVRAARALARPGESLLYFRRDGGAWVVRDPATLARVRTAWAPANAIGKKMEPLGKKMEMIGARQSAVGAKMEPIGLRMGEIGTRMASASDDQRDALRAEMDALQGKMRLLQKKMEALSGEMRPFSEEMQRLGEDMKRAASAAEEELAAILDDAFARGLAQPVK